MISPARYHLLSVLSILFTGPLRCLATPLTRRWDKVFVKHAWDGVPENWESRNHPHIGTTIDLYLELTSRDEDALINALYEVSEPSHPKYGAHLSKEQIAALVAPHPDTLNLVNSWLEDHGVPSSSVSATLGGNWLTVTGMPVARANAILGASYQLYQHVETNDTVLRTISYSLPEALHGHIRTVSPTTYFGSPRAVWKKERMRRPSAGESVARTDANSEELATTVLPGREFEPVTPSYLRSLYKTMGYVPAAMDRNALGTSGYDMQYPSQQDLKDFMLEYRTDGEDATFTVVKVNGGGYDENDPGVEASLNLQFAEAMSYPTPNIYYSTGGTRYTTFDPWVNWLIYVLTQERIPQTISTTYGDWEHRIPGEYANGVCKLLAIFGARGVSVLFASGDWGVGDGQCLFRDSAGNVGVRFLTIFPATCPWVTSVGGTTRDNPEVAAELSGGGFSNYFPRPPYQANAVSTYLQNLGNTYEGLYNPAGRGFPDIAAQALHFAIIWGGKIAVRDGTSASAPVVAGIISLLNDYLLSKGENPLGFINPLLYGEGLEGLNDIISGSNPGCGTNGFSAIAGWDPVTGLGSPDFDKLENIIDDLLRRLRAPRAIN